MKSRRKTHDITTARFSRHTGRPKGGYHRKKLATSEACILVKGPDVSPGILRTSHISSHVLRETTEKPFLHKGIMIYNPNKELVATNVDS